MHWASNALAQKIDDHASVGEDNDAAIDAIAVSAVVDPVETDNRVEKQESEWIGKQGTSRCPYIPARTSIDSSNLSSRSEESIDHRAEKSPLIPDVEEEKKNLKIEDYFESRFV